MKWNERENKGSMTEVMMSYLSFLYWKNVVEDNK